MKNKIIKLAISASILFSAGTAAATAAATAVYIADNQNHAIRMVNIGTGIITTVAGTGVAGFSGDGGPATQAQLHNPFGVAVDATGNIYIADTGNNRVRKIAVGTGVITTIAGNGSPSYSGDGGTATAAGLNYPTGVAVDTLGNVYVADQRNNRIREIGAGIITTAAGNGNVGNSGDGGPAITAALYYPTGIAVDAYRNLYIADSNNQKIREVVFGIINTVAGTGSVGYTCSPGPSATAVGLHTPTGVSVDVSNEMFIADYGNQCVRVISTGIDAFAIGTGTPGYSGDGGSGPNAELNYPFGVAADALGGNLYIADYVNHVIRAVAYADTISTFAGTGTPGYSGDGGPATKARLYNPTGVAFQ
jgi:trimeric autotransporter adhesin